MRLTSDQILQKKKIIQLEDTAEEPIQNKVQRKKLEGNNMKKKKITWTASYQNLVENFSL